MCEHPCDVAMDGRARIRSAKDLRANLVALVKRPQAIFHHFMQSSTLDLDQVGEQILYASGLQDLAEMLHEEQLRFEIAYSGDLCDQPDIILSRSVLANIHAA